MSTHYRFPKWLMEERFIINRDWPRISSIWKVSLFEEKKPYRVFDGFGESIAQAAKDARKKRDASPGGLTSDSRPPTSGK